MTFSGSYRSEDVTFLLKPLPLQEFVAVPDKERLIQSGRRHYSEMLSPESSPSARYLELFEAARRANDGRMARACLRLASLIAARREGPITVVSLARAGTPVGVVVSRLLSARWGREVKHYSISIIRDRGVDTAALRHILALGHSPESLVFVDGWTGKGVIGRELERSVTSFNEQCGTDIDDGLYVLADLSGTAACAASYDDWLIPSAILNAPVSGLVSRSILNHAIGPDDFHGCVYYRELAPYDRSQAFADDLVLAALALPDVSAGAPDVATRRKHASDTARSFVAETMRKFGIDDVNLVKPGIGEATRVLLRRVPHLVLLREPDSPDVVHLQQLAAEKQVAIEIDPRLPYNAVSLIRREVDA